MDSDLRGVIFSFIIAVVAAVVGAYFTSIIRGNPLARFLAAAITLLSFIAVIALGVLALILTPNTPDPASSSTATTTSLATLSPAVDLSPTITLPQQSTGTVPEQFTPEPPTSLPFTPVPPTIASATVEVVGPCDSSPINPQDGVTVSLEARWYVVEVYDNDASPPVHRFILQEGPGTVIANPNRGQRAWRCPSRILAENNASASAIGYKASHPHHQVFGPVGQEVYYYGKLCQFKDTPGTCLAPPGVVCALYFYPHDGDEKTFVFASDPNIDESLIVQNYMGTLSCWNKGYTPTFTDVCGSCHPLANLDEVMKVGITFSRNVTPIDATTLSP